MYAHDSQYVTDILYIYNHFMDGDGGAFIIKDMTGFFYSAPCQSSKQDKRENIISFVMTTHISCLLTSETLGKEWNGADYK